ncbi:hypothetical protein FJTKL_02536 [Diaporthe vaccinii]|uniref:Allantoin permease n=2 Tax=Diaporthe vaccinii TaxID=105482 RepID=A0ABR4DY36_9PEZI
MGTPSASKSDSLPWAWLKLGYWRLETATRDGWSNEDVDVVAPDKRTWREIDYLWLWLADGANVGTMQQAGSILALGLSWRETSAAIAIGNVLIAMTVALNGSIGSKHHIPFSIASRASMGFYFSYFAVMSRLVLGLIYFGINTYIGASCMLIMLESIWPSLRELPNTLAVSSSISSNKMIAYFVFWIFQFPLLLINPRKMKWLFLIKSVCAVVAAFAMLGWGLKTGGVGPVFSQPARVSGNAKRWAWIMSINVAVSGKTTLALNISDLTRYGKKPSVAYWQFLFIPVVYWSFSFIGIVIASAGQSIYGTLYWDPTSIIGLWTNRAAAFFCAFAFGLATLGTNISTNSIATSNDLAFLLPRWLNIRRGAVVTAFIGGWVTCPWKIQDSAKSLTTFLSGYIIVLAPVVAIMISDYWIICSRKLHVPMLYQNDGIYRYSYGVNWRALVTLLIVFPVNLPGLIHAIDARVDIGNYTYFYKASWLTATFISAGIYLALSLAFPYKTLRIEDVSDYNEDTALDSRQVENVLARGDKNQLV